MSISIRFILCNNFNCFLEGKHVSGDTTQKGCSCGRCESYKHEDRVETVLELTLVGIQKFLIIQYKPINILIRGINSSRMDSSNSQSMANSQVTYTRTYDDELDRCEQVSEIKARIMELEKHQAQTKQRKQRFLANREERIKNGRQVSLSISNNASAIFSTAKSRKQLDQQINRYQNIANLTQQENNNLKQQNQYLLEKLKKMREKEKKFVKIAEKAQKYKELYESALQELEVAKEQCEVYKTKAQQMKKIALLDVGKLENKILPFMKTMDETDSANSEAFSRGKSKQTREEIEANYSTQI